MAVFLAVLVGLVIILGGIGTGMYLDRDLHDRDGGISFNDAGRFAWSFVATLLAVVVTTALILSTY